MTILIAPAIDPSDDIRARVAAQSGVVESVDKIWFHKLAAAVIDADRCVRCGTCVSACPSGSIGLATDGLPTLVRMCTGCSSCWDFCPLAGLRAERLPRLLSGQNGVQAQPDRSAALPLAHTDSAHPQYVSDVVGPVRQALEARAAHTSDTAQDGGVVTALLAALINCGYLDGAIVSKRDNALRGRTVLVTTGQEVLQTAGNVYDQSYPLATLAQGLPASVEKVALVGTPCQIAGLRALQQFPWRYRAAPVEKVTLSIALFCTRSFDPQRLEIELLRNRVDISRIHKVDIRDGWFRACDRSGNLLCETRVSALSRARLRGCDECADFTGACADISVGNVGSEPGYTTVLIRTERGAEAWAQAEAVLDIAPLPALEMVTLQAERNQIRALRSLRRAHGPDLPLWVSYSGHLAAYAGTDRAPVAPPPHRSHHYAVSC